MIGQSTENLIDPNKMSHILSALLSRQSGLRVKRVNNFPAEAVHYQKDAQSHPKVLMYRHRLHLELEGTFYQVSNYLKMIENLQERLYWDEMDFTMGNYPKGILLLNVHTLSMSKDLIGVYD